MWSHLPHSTLLLREHLGGHNYLSGGFFQPCPTNRQPPIGSGGCWTIPIWECNARQVDFAECSLLGFTWLFEHIKKADDHSKDAAGAGVEFGDQMAVDSNCLPEQSVIIGGADVLILPQVSELLAVSMERMFRGSGWDWLDSFGHGRRCWFWCFPKI